MNDTTPQFGSAEYSNVPGTERCVLCKELIGASYYRIHNKMVCVGCGEKVKNGQPVEDGSSYVRALGFGAAGAFAGFVLYATVSIVTGWQIGLVSLAVGYLVAAAMKKGSRGVGGRKYQATAAALTYVAVSMAAIPLYFYLIREGKVERPEQAQTQSQRANDASSKSASGGDAEKSAPASDEKPSVAGAGAAIGMLVLIGLASPFLELSSSASGVIGLIILFVGMQYAWKAMAASPIAVDGPYENSQKPLGASAG